VFKADSWSESGGLLDVIKESHRHVWDILEQSRLDVEAET